MLPRGDQGAHTAILTLATAVSAYGTAICEVATANLAHHTAIFPFNTANQPRRLPGLCPDSFLFNRSAEQPAKKTTARAFAWAVVPCSSKPR